MLKDTDTKKRDNWKPGELYSAQSFLPPKKKENKPLSSNHPLKIERNEKTLWEII